MAAHAHALPGTITLTDSQQAALEAMLAFYNDPAPPNLNFVLAGFAGTGKTTLIRAFISELEKINQALSLITTAPTSHRDKPRADTLRLYLTATTHKAAEALEHATGREAGTLHSALGLTLEKDYQSNTTSLSVVPGRPKLFDAALIIDEAGFATEELLDLLDERAPGCKRILIGDPYQLVDHTISKAPVFERKYPGVQLTQIVRQEADNPIIEAATAFRHWVSHGAMMPIFVDGQALRHLSREHFNQVLVDDFARGADAWRSTRLLAWTNKRVIEYNRALSERYANRMHFEVGDIAINARYLSNRSGTVRVDRQVTITQMNADRQFDVHGWRITIDDRTEAFLPANPADRSRIEAMLRQQNDTAQLRHLDRFWADLRHVYACTVNKSQGSTYERVYIDLDDINRCRRASQVARMLYVAVSRARQQVIFTGDITGF